ncbi:hypothetical protein BH23GEM7_BH23GEM7_37410 [soil metagenome]
MFHEPPEDFTRKLRAAEDLAARLQKPDWATQANLNKLRDYTREALDFVRSQRLTFKRKRQAALEVVEQHLDRIHDLGTLDARWRLESVFFALRVARTGRGSVAA